MLLVVVACAAAYSGALRGRRQHGGGIGPGRRAADQRLVGSRACCQALASLLLRQSSLPFLVLLFPELEVSVHPARVGLPRRFDGNRGPG
jgi:hypothetical protein